MLGRCRGEGRGVVGKSRDVGVIMLTNKADARERVSVMAKANIYGTLHGGNRGTVLMSVFYKLRPIS